jgi:hypothetical protein
VVPSIYVLVARTRVAVRCRCPADAEDTVPDLAEAAF